MRRRSDISWIGAAVAALAWALALLTPPPGTGARAQSDDARLLAYGRHLANECTSCHRIDGVDNGIPSITGWPMPTFIETMRFYQSGSRPNPVMVSVSQSLDDGQIAALAAFYGSLPKPAKKR